MLLVGSWLFLVEASMLLVGGLGAIGRKSNRAKIKDQSFRSILLVASCVVWPTMVKMVNNGQVRR